MNFHPIPGTGVTAGISAVVLDFEAAKTAEFHPVALQKRVFHTVHRGIDHHGSIVHGYAGLIGNGFDQLAFIHHSFLPE
jgi:hypothetical protein